VVPFTFSRFGRPDASRAGGTPELLTTEELAERWRRSAQTVKRRYAAWGLHPLRLGGGFLFPIHQILQAEERAMRDTAREDSRNAPGGRFAARAATPLNKRKAPV
jgi:hypothetical protein